MTVDSKCSLSPSSSINRILCKLKILNNCIHEDHRGNPLWYNFLLKIISQSTFYPDVISVTGVVLRKVSLIIVTTATLIVTERCLKTEINEISEVKRANYASARRQLWTTRAQLPWLACFWIFSTLIIIVARKGLKRGKVWAYEMSGTAARQLFETKLSKLSPALQLEYKIYFWKNIKIICSTAVLEYKNYLRLNYP